MPASSRQSLIIANRLSELSRMERWLADLLVRWELPPRTGFALDLVLNEALTNLISYAYSDDEPHEILVTVTHARDVVTVEVFDDGEVFNPFDAPALVAAPDLEHADIGGRGIHLIKSYADHYDYGRVAGRNRLTLVVRKDPNG